MCIYIYIYIYVYMRSNRAQAKSWHVPDEQLQDLVHSLKKQDLVDAHHVMPNMHCIIIM